MKKDELKKTRQYKSLNNNKQYLARVPLYFCTRFDLSPTELLIFCMIHNATINFELKSYTGSLKGICVALNVSIPTVQKALLKLEEKGFIRKKESDRKGRLWISYIALLSYNSETAVQSFEDVLCRNRMFNEENSVSYRRGTLKRVGAVNIMSRNA